jgi:ABC-2 type transport system permease protein
MTQREHESLRGHCGNRQHLAHQAVRVADALVNGCMQQLVLPDMEKQSSVPRELLVIWHLRWRMFVNRLRTRRAQAEFISRLLITSVFAFAGLGAFVFAAGLSWYFVSQNQAEYLAVIFWPVLLFWQFFPMMATAFANNPDSSELLRFPLTYRSYFLVRLAYGFFDPASAIGTVALIGTFLGITFARPLLFPWALLVLFTYGAFNLVLMQMIFAWLERWLAQRRTREIFGVLFILAMLSFQLIGPLVQHLGRGPHADLGRALQIGGRVQAVLPPGFAADAIAGMAQTHPARGFTSLLVLASMTFVIGYLLHLRIRAQYRGENLSEVAARPVSKQKSALQIGWHLPGFSQSVAAVFEKEIRYLARSGPMLLTLIMPMFMLVIFRLGPLSAMRHSSAMSRTPDVALPGASAYALLVLTNLVYNSFGGDGGGLQFFYASPVRFSQIVLAKNLTHGAILLLNAAFAWIAVTYLYGTPHLAVTIATIAGLLFAAPLNFTAGNLLSFYSPKKRDFSTFGRQNVSQTTVLASFGMQAVIVGIGAAVFALARAYHNLWIASLLFLILAAISISIYLTVLRRMDRIALQRRETLIGELCRA